VEGSTDLAVQARSGAFLGAGEFLLGGEMELGFEHVNALERLDVLAAVVASKQAGATTLHPYLGAIGGVRQEWLGSFRQSRFPLGVAAGVRALVSERAAVRLDYRWLHFFDDPVEDFDEQQLVAGISLFLCNAPR
jgi:hypothetical protein